MKKFISILMVLAMVLALSVPAFAAEDDGSISITNATIGETYAVYKIFDVRLGKDFNGVPNAVSYHTTSDSQFFEALFGADGTAENAYFEYNENTGSVEKKEKVKDTDLINYLTDLVAKGTYTMGADPITAETEEVKFEDLPYGYYLITSTLGAAVTINSNTPDVSVIDKNQKPGADFDKYVQTGVDEDGNPIWAESNSANIGDEITYRIAFEATNYDGDKKIKYYQVHDEKGDAIWADFESFEVYVNGELLPRGYYLDQGNMDNGDWEFLGDWSDIPEEDRNVNNAQWYLVHLGEDQFRITIPWLEDQVLVNDHGTYTLQFSDFAASKYDSPAEVEIIYKAVVEANAIIGNDSKDNRYNKAYASWTSENETGSTKPEEVVTKVYGIGLLKDDLATKVNLAGAKFRIYRDEDCTDPVYVIPTDIAGVYIVDSLGTPLEDVTGDGKKTSRDLYEKYLEDYLGENEQDNYVVSQVNGKLAVLGLEAGTYYLEEVEAPSGYNALNQTIEITAGQDIRPFIIFAAVDGTVADIQTENSAFSEYRLDLTHIVVHNSKGVELPSTGGEGAVWLITIGTVMAIGFAVFLITHKKMSIYTD